MCISHLFSLCQRISTQVKWQSQSCGIGQKVKDGLQPPSPLGGGKEPTGCLFLSHSGGSMAAQTWQDAYVATSHTAKVNPRACPKGLVQSWPVKIRAWNQRHTAPGWLSNIIPFPPKQESVSPPVADSGTACELPACDSFPFLGQNGWSLVMGCPKPPKIHQEGTELSLCQAGCIPVQPQWHLPASPITLPLRLLATECIGPFC